MDSDIDGGAEILRRRHDLFMKICIRNLIADYVRGLIMIKRLILKNLFSGILNGRF